MKHNRHSALALFGIIFCVLTIGFFGSVYTTPAIATWYVTLNKPSFNPPNWIFAPVWTTLYVLMGSSAYLVWSRGKNKPSLGYALSLFGLQLILNLLWSLLFFGLHSPIAAMFDIVLLWAAIAGTMRYFFPISKTAAYLLLPYLLWVSFAGILNAAIVMLN